jgi:hypothetical protein
MKEGHVAELDATDVPSDLVRRVTAHLLDEVTCRTGRSDPDYRCF